MPKPWTSHLIIKALGVKKCNGSLDAATEDLSLEKAMDVARQKQKDGHLTGADLEDTKLAIASFKEAIRLKPDYAEIHFYLGMAYKRLGVEQEKAIASY